MTAEQDESKRHRAAEDTAARKKSCRGMAGRETPGAARDSRRYRKEIGGMGQGLQSHLVPEDYDALENASQWLARQASFS